MSHFPYRIAFLAPRLSASTDAEAAIPWVARILEAVIYEHVLRHPALGLEDFGDTSLFDEADNLLNVDSGEVNERLRTLFEDYRRSEVLWLEFALGSDQGNVSLMALRYDGNRQAFTAQGQGPLSARI